MNCPAFNCFYGGHFILGCTMRVEGERDALSGFWFLFLGGSSGGEAVGIFPGRRTLMEWTGVLVRTASLFLQHHFLLLNTNWTPSTISTTIINLIGSVPCFCPQISTIYIQKTNLLGSLPITREANLLTANISRHRRSGGHLNFCFYLLLFSLLLTDR